MNRIMSIEMAFQGILKASDKDCRPNIDRNVVYCKKIRSTFSHEK